MITTMRDEMITVSILINGKPIYTRSAVNRGEVFTDASRLKKVCQYAVDDGTDIFHDPKDGAVKLAKTLLDTIKEQK